MTGKAREGIMTYGPDPIPQQDWEGAERFPESAERTPVVFMLKPTHYKVVETPEELRLWERLMIERIGFDPDSPTLRRDEGGDVEMRMGRETISGKAPMTLDD